MIHLVRRSPAALRMEARLTTVKETMKVSRASPYLGMGSGSSRFAADAAEEGVRSEW
jgi:hypothetical protein